MIQHLSIVVIISFIMIAIAINQDQIIKKAFLKVISYNRRIFKILKNGG
jgi:hypothetical protein